jgi:hypothetical protein
MDLRSVYVAYVNFIAGVVLDGSSAVLWFFLIFLSRNRHTRSIVLPFSLEADCRFQTGPSLILCLYGGCAVGVNRAA